MFRCRGKPPEIEGIEEESPLKTPVLDEVIGEESSLKREVLDTVSGLFSHQASKTAPTVPILTSNTTPTLSHRA